MKVTLGKLLFAIAAIFAVMSMSGDSVPRFFFLTSHQTVQQDASGNYIFDFDADGIYIDLDKTQSITFEEEDGHFVLVADGIRHSLDKNVDESRLMSGELTPEQTSVHLDKNPQYPYTDPRSILVHIGREVDFINLEVKNEIPRWLNATLTNTPGYGGGLALSVDENDSGEAREAVVKIGYKGLDESVDIHVRQEPELFLDICQEVERAKYFGGRYYVLADGAELCFEFLKGIDLHIESIEQFNDDGSGQSTEDEKIDISYDIDKASGKMMFNVGPNRGKRVWIFARIRMGSQEREITLFSLKSGEEYPETPHIVFETNTLHLDRDAQNPNEQECRWWTVRYNENLLYGGKVELKSALPEWIEDWQDIGIGIELKIKHNATGTPRDADLDFGFVGGGVEQTVHVRQEAELFLDICQEVEGAKYFGGRYYVLADGAELCFEFLKGIDLHIESIEQFNDDGSGQSTEDEKIDISYDIDKASGKMTLDVGPNRGKHASILVHIRMGSQERDITLYSLKSGEEYPETPHIAFETNTLHLDRDAQNIDEQECRWWTVRYNENLIYGEKVELKSALPEWIEDWQDIGIGIELKIKHNTTGTPRDADLDFGFVGGGVEQTVHVRQEAELFISDDMQEPGYVIFEPGPKNYVQPDGDTFVFKFKKNAPFEIGPTRQFVSDPDERNLEGDERIPFDIKVNQEVGTVTYTIGRNNYIRTTIDTEFKIGSQPYVIRFEVMAPGMPSFAEQKEALIDLYNKTDGANWNLKTNWISDAPLALWHGVRVCGKYVTHIYLAENRLVGAVPNESLMILFKTPIHFEISGNGLYGHVSDELQAMPEWTKHGLSLIFQSPYESGQRRITNYKRNIPLGDRQVEYLFEEDGTAMLYDILATHKLTHFGLSEPDEFLANMQLSYPGQFQNIGIHAPAFEDRATKQSAAIKHPWWGHYVHLYDALKDSPIRSVIGSNMLVDDKGYIVEIMYRDWDVPASYYQDIVTETAREILGEPTEHEWFRYPDDSEIQDTKNDGKYKCLHKATTARGLDIVLMGDGFGAADNEEGARYEQLMKEAAESILSMEPLKSLSDRINIHMVHVVSQSTNVGDGKTALNYDDDKCRQYAAKIPDIDLQNVTIVNIANRLQWEGSSYCNMKSEGWAVAHIVNGGVSPVMLHEVCGHGIGRFLDEYILNGYSDNKVSDENYSDFCAWLDAMHSAGMGLNVDYHSNPEDVYWSQMLADERYNGLAGIYQGAHQYPFDLYRSTENSLMGTANSSMSAVQRMIVYKRIMSLSEGPEWQFDYETFADFDTPNR